MGCATDVGGVIRDKSDTWLGGFSINSSVRSMKLWVYHFRVGLAFGGASHYDGCGQYEGGGYY